MRRTLITSAVAVGMIAGTMGTAEAKTAAGVQGPHVVKHGQRFDVTASGGTDGGGKVRLCVARMDVRHRLVPQACVNVGLGRVTAHQVERWAGRFTYVAAIYSLKDGHMESVSAPITVTAR